jgi:hypothetical protein
MDTNRGKTAIRSFRVDEAALEVIEKEAKTRSVSVNTLVNQMLVSFVNFDTYLEPLSMVKICPTLVCDPEGDVALQGQPEALYAHLTCEKTLMRFTNAEGAGLHTQIGASRLAFARIFDWVSETLAM